MSESEFLKGWKAARAQYQERGGVTPYPPGYEQALQKETVIERKPQPKVKAEAPKPTKEKKDG